MLKCLPEAPGDRVDHVRDQVPVDGVAGVGGVQPQLLHGDDGLLENLILLENLVLLDSLAVKENK